MTTCLTLKHLKLQYSQPITQCVRQLRLFPAPQRGSQQLLDIQWRCTPEPTTSQVQLDDFGNAVLELHHERIETEFDFTLELKAQSDTMSCARDENVPEAGIGAFLLPSQLCNSDPVLQTYLDRLKQEGVEHDKPTSAEATIAVCHSLCEWLYNNIEYLPDSTSLYTRASQVLETRRGVCQDFAHVMIALCRTLRIPARYISGYNAGEGAMHAWVETLCGDTWHSWDPTHGRPTRPDCVFVACGRDFRDVSPLRGSFHGPAHVTLESWSETRVL